MLRVERVSKSFGPVRALHEVSLDAYAGEVHGVLGENGAGKSTLMNAVAGFVRPDEGRIVLEGETVLDPGNPHFARRNGVQMVHQHFMLVPEFTVAENFALGTLEGLNGAFESEESARRASDVAQRLGWQLDPTAKAGRLPVGAQQRLEIVKALAREAKVLILDEPTAVLSPGETEELFEVLRGLKEQGTCVLLIAHKLSEVLSVCDRVSVLRRGEHVATAAIGSVDARQLAEWMVGEVPQPQSPLHAAVADPTITVTDLHVRGDRGDHAVRGISFVARPGEILGIGGVDGNGQTELAEALAGVRRAHKGNVALAVKGGVGFIPQDRQRQGLALDMSVLDNYRIGSLGGALLSPKADRQQALALVQKYDVRLGSLDDPVRSLSGGNQQKVVVSRVLSQNPAVFVAHNPTRGLDVRATAFVQAKIIEAAQNGAAVVLLSTDLDEVVALSSRVLFMKRGELFEGGAEAMVG